MFQKLFLNKGLAHDLNIVEILFISCSFSCMLLVGRAAITGLVTYGFLLWNLFLAIVPFIISRWMARKKNLFESRIRLLLALMAWLLFIPNSFYIITDLFHLDKFDSASKWFDLLLIFSFAWNGLLLGFLSVREVEKIVERTWGQGLSIIVLFTVMWLNAFGVYLGRYLRFNSWDIITQPVSLFQEIAEVLMHPFQNKMQWGMITVFASFMLLLYITFKKLNEAFHGTKH
jgi:uncharacterized membrane protein